MLYLLKSATFGCAAHALLNSSTDHTGTYSQGNQGTVLYLATSFEHGVALSFLPSLAGAKAQMLYELHVQALFDYFKTVDVKCLKLKIL